MKYNDEMCAKLWFAIDEIGYDYEKLKSLVIAMLQVSCPNKTIEENINLLKLCILDYQPIDGGEMNDL